MGALSKILILADKEISVFFVKALLGFANIPSLPSRFKAKWIGFK